jgi:hypothetical protein
MIKNERFSIDFNKLILNIAVQEVASDIAIFINQVGILQWRTRPNLDFSTTMEKFQREATLLYIPPLDTNVYIGDNLH